VARGEIYCPHCETVTTAKVLDWDDQSEARYLGMRDFAMGNFYWTDDPSIHFYRRVRQCARCGDYLYTGEVDLDLIDELVALRRKVRDLEKNLIPELKALQAKLREIEGDAAKAFRASKAVHDKLQT
jgi:hypothetical protein